MSSQLYRYYCRIRANTRSYATFVHSSYVYTCKIIKVACSQLVNSGSKDIFWLKASTRINGLFTTVLSNHTTLVSNPFSFQLMETLANLPDVSKKFLDGKPKHHLILTWHFVMRPNYNRHRHKSGYQKESDNKRLLSLSLCLERSRHNNELVAHIVYINLSPITESPNTEWTLPRFKILTKKNTTQRKPLINLLFLSPKAFKGCG